MANNIVAYAGISSFDVILYLSRILNKLNRKVLVVDHSETKALTYSIPQIPGVDIESCCINNRRVDFTTGAIDEKLTAQYDDILIDCGYNEPKINHVLLTKIVYVTDMYEFSMLRLADTNFFYEVKCELALLIREAVETKLTAEYIISHIKKNVSTDKVTVLFRDEADYENCLLCHHNKVFRFNHISDELKNYLVEEANKLCKESTIKQIKHAYSKAEKGE